MIKAYEAFQSHLVTFLDVPFLILSASWFDCYKTSHSCLAVVALATISKMKSSRHWWMIVSSY
jgi:hypothetical protein